MPISNLLIVRILRIIKKETGHNEDDMDLIRYSLQAILWEAEKLIYLFLIFLALGQQWAFLACMGAVIPVRFFSGGFHASSSWRCFFWTLLGFALAIFVLPFIPLSNAVVILVGTFAVLVIFIASPVRSKQMEEIANKIYDKHKKYIATVITVSWFILIYINQHFYLTEFVMWIIFLQSLQLLIEYTRIKLKMR